MCDKEIAIYAKKFRKLLASRKGKNQERTKELLRNSREILFQPIERGVLRVTEDKVPSNTMSCVPWL